MVKRTTIEDLAQASGVSVATVDRVLNGRTKVREETAKRVYDAALKMNYHGLRLIEKRINAHKPTYKLAFVLQKKTQDFYINVTNGLRSAAEQYNHAQVSVDFYYAKDQVPSEFAELFLKAGRSAQAVAGCAMDHHQVAYAVKKLKDQNIPVFSLFSDFAQGLRECYIGLNNVKVGRGTAWLLSKIAKPGKVALFVGGQRWHGHELRETGFRSYFRELGADFTLLDTVVNQEKRITTYEVTRDLISKHKDLTALYCAGGGMEGALEAVQAYSAPGQIAVAVNEDTPITRDALQSRALAFANITPLSQICEDVIAMMIEAIERGYSEAPRQYFFEQGYLFPEML